MTRNPKAHDQIVLRVLPFEDHCYLYFEHGSPGVLPRGVGRIRSHRLALRLDDLDLEHPGMILEMLLYGLRKAQAV